MTEYTIAVLGAAGRTGRPLVRALKKRGARVLAISRRAGQPNLFFEQVEARFGDLQSVESLEIAFRGANAIHYIPPSLEPRDPEFARNIIAAARRAGVSRVVYHSVLHPYTPEMPHHVRKAGVELQLRHSPLSWTVIQPAMYAQTVFRFFDVTTGLLTPPFDTTRPFTPIHEEDLAEAAAIIHTTEGHAFATYELAGPELLDSNAMGDRLSSVLGRPITTRKVAADPSRLAATLGLDADQVRERCLMFDYYDRYGLIGNGKVLRMILGREPADFAEAARHSLAVSPASSNSR
jgi:NAD(P)H dehydrogenase (quinone)